MTYSAGANDLRSESRVGLDLPAQISIGSQLTLQGTLKDLSLKSAFIKIKFSVNFQINDEIGFTLLRSADSDAVLIRGIARISRIAEGEGLAIYFTEMDSKYMTKLKALLKQ